MKVVKKVKLLSKDRDGNFIKNNTYKVERNRAVISEESVKSSEATYKETGILYIVDEEATKEWLKSKEPKNNNKDVLEFEGVIVTEENVDQFIADNDVNIGRAKTAEAKLKKVNEFINNK